MFKKKWRFYCIHLTKRSAPSPLIASLFPCSDVEKARTTYQKLVGLHREFNQQDQVIRCYGALTLTFSQDGGLSSPDSATNVSSCSEAWLDFATYLLGREKVPEECWTKVRRLGMIFMIFVLFVVVVVVVVVVVLLAAWRVWLDSRE